MNKGLGVDDIFRFCSAFTTVRMPFCHGIIFGMPGETRQTADTTVRNVEATMPAAAIAVPGVRVYKNTLLAQTLVKSFTAESEYPFGLKPYHYISPEVKDWLVPFVSGLPARGKNWIIPGNSQNEIEVIGRMRQMKKRGPAWQFKQMARFAG
jgi:radical SAM superfamily enzyme